MAAWPQMVIAKMEKTGEELFWEVESTGLVKVWKEEGVKKEQKQR